MYFEDPGHYIPHYSGNSPKRFRGISRHPRPPHPLTTPLLQPPNPTLARKLQLRCSQNDILIKFTPFPTGFILYPNAAVCRMFQKSDFVFVSRWPGGGDRIFVECLLCISLVCICIHYILYKLSIYIICRDRTWVGVEGCWAWVEESGVRCDVVSGQVRYTLKLQLCNCNLDEWIYILAWLPGVRWWHDDHGCISFPNLIDHELECLCMVLIMYSTVFEYEIWFTPHPAIQNCKDWIHLKFKKTIDDDLFP